MKERTHPVTGKPMGQWVRSMGSRWWEGECTCGSGEYGHEEYDANGIYFGISCVKCNRVPAPGPYDEQIEDDY